MYSVCKRSHLLYKANNTLNFISIMSSCLSLDLLSVKQQEVTIKSWSRQHSHSISEGITNQTYTQSDSYDFSYKEAIKALNGLQTNAQTIAQSVQLQRERGSNSSNSLDKTIYFLSLLDIKLEDLNRLNVIHVSGTKGKGSTCAFVDSILRQYGYRTGFYSSPHLVAARERIRINGEPLNKRQFANYFWSVYKTIERRKDETIGMPPYFNFLTVMAFHVFLHENIDATVLEVGIGGQFDCTNVVPEPIVTGVTSLGLDHCQLLGNTIDQIAWHKSGIFKPSTPAFTVEQPLAAMKVLKSRSQEKKCSLYVCPLLSLYPHSVPVNLGIKGDCQRLNASLALQLANTWLNKDNDKYHIQNLITKDGTFADIFPLNRKQLLGLSSCVWPGRCQILRQNNCIYFLDGAHTYESLANCSKWFWEESQKLLTSNRLVRVLLFNCTGDRPTETLMKAIDAKFDIAIFCPNKVDNNKDFTSDNSNFTVTSQKQMDICNTNAKIWAKYNEKTLIAIHSCITDAIKYIIDKTQKQKALPVHILVTGSVHLVGNVLAVIDSDMSSLKS
ncbi:folylpolyglutamate synthase, mitochondrial-like isoform X2 [Oppia nitens]|nr:folylpolyglutamate synthase, mitochondrial-like isoform X2 [Oppia nitens]